MGVLGYHIVLLLVEVLVFFVGEFVWKLLTFEKHAIRWDVYPDADLEIDARADPQRRAGRDVLGGRAVVVPDLSP